MQVIFHSGHKILCDGHVMGNVNDKYILLEISVYFM